MYAHFKDRAYTISHITAGPFKYLRFNEVDGEYPESRFTLAPEPKVYSGADLASFEDGIYLQTEDHYPYLLFVSEGVSVAMVISKTAPWGSTHTSDIDECDLFIRIANSISDIFVDGIMEMEGI